MSNITRLQILLAIAALCIGGLAQAQIQFTDRSTDWGVTHSAPSITTSFADWDGDGDPDLHVQNFSTVTSKWYRNDLDTSPSQFTDVTDLYNVGHNLAGWAAAWGDFDSDGDPDVYLSNGDFQATPDDNILWRNDGGTTFTNVTDELGLTETRFSQSVMWVDFDRDGLLDMHLTMEVDPHRMLKQLPNGTFEDVSTSVGLHDPQSHSYGLSWADLDGDGDLDTIVTTCGVSSDPNDGGALTRDRLWRNMLSETGTATFDEIAPQLGVNRQDNMYGNELVDADNDGDFDMYVDGATSIAPNVFYENPGNLNTAWQEIGTSIGISATSERSHGVEWVDYDNDGDLDLWVHDDDGTDQLHHNQLIETGIFVFEDVAIDVGLNQHDVQGFDGAWADVDGDGDMDLSLSTRSINPVYESNVAQQPNPNRWLFVNLRGDFENGGDTRSGYGATIRVRTGDVTMTRFHGGQPGAFAQNYLPTHFGLGQNDIVDEITVDWLTSGTTTIPGPLRISNRSITIYQNPDTAGLFVK
jgi:hypothetical protein